MEEEKTGAQPEKKKQERGGVHWLKDRGRPVEQKGCACGCAVFRGKRGRMRQGGGVRKTRFNTGGGRRISTNRNRRIATQGSCWGRKEPPPSGKKFLGSRTRKPFPKTSRRNRIHPFGKKKKEKSSGDKKKEKQSVHLG